MKHRFVEHIPEILEDDTIYVSITFETVIHKCACGCGNEVVTPLSPAEWSLTFDGESVSLHPSIGNWSLNCRSHYWIRKNRVEWSYQWSDSEIMSAKNNDLQAKREHYQKVEKNMSQTTELSPILQKENRFWTKLKSRFRKLLRGRSK